MTHSADVFAIELLDIGQHHRVLFGEDPVADIEVPMNLHRVQVEHELRTALQKLRHIFCASATTNRSFAKCTQNPFPASPRCFVIS